MKKKFCKDCGVEITKENSVELDCTFKDGNSYKGVYCKDCAQRIMDQYSYELSWTNQSFSNPFVNSFIDGLFGKPINEMTEYTSIDGKMYIIPANIRK